MPRFRKRPHTKRAFLAARRASGAKNSRIECSHLRKGTLEPDDPPPQILSPMTPPNPANRAQSCEEDSKATVVLLFSKILRQRAAVRSPSSHTRDRIAIAFGKCQVRPSPSSKEIARRQEKALYRTISEKVRRTFDKERLHEDGTSVGGSK